MALITNECRIRGNTAKRKSQSIPSIQRLEICFVKTQSRFRSLESRTCNEGTREIEKLSAFLVANFSCGIYYSLACAKKKTTKAPLVFFAVALISRVTSVLSYSYFVVFSYLLFIILHYVSRANRFINFLSAKKNVIVLLFSLLNAFFDLRPNIPCKLK